MSGVVLVLALSYVAVAALLLNLNLATPYRPWIKFSAIALVSALYLASWQGLHGLLGWASPDPLPDEFRVLWITIDEPVVDSTEPGGIFFWVRRLDEAGLPIGAPRAHRIPWGEDAAEAAQDALQRMNEGELLNGRMGRNLVQEAASDDSGADYIGEGSVTGDGGATPDFEFVRVPPPALPAKGSG
ncbi:MAG: hypothetical protein RIC56_13610 [Pseudomonadales bacterium]